VIAGLLGRPVDSLTLEAADITPVAGATNTITITVVDYKGVTNTSFSGTVNITISGY
jgi:hypothetical protein